MSIFLLGDIHGNLKPVKRWAEEISQPGDTLIQVGDFGAGFLHIERIKSVSRELEKAGCEMLVIRGNHDDPSWFDGRCIGGNITFLPSNTIRDIEDKRFIFMGGAVSVDRQLRVPDRDWWYGEEYIHNTDFLNQATDINIVVTHTAPQVANPCVNNDLSYYTSHDHSLQRDLLNEGAKMGEAFDILAANNNVEKWFYGHFHVSANTFINGTIFNCLNIDEIKQL